MRSVIGSEVRLGSHCLYMNRDVLCGFLLCVNISGAPRLGDLGGDISSVTFYHQGKELDCRNNHRISRDQEVYGEGNGTPLQYSCLETPMDGGAW